MARNGGDRWLPATLPTRTASMVSELVADKLAEAGDDPGGGFTHWKLDLRPQARIKSGLRQSSDSRSLTEADDDLGDEIGGSRSTGRSHGGVGIVFQMRSDSQELAGVDGISPKDRSNDLSLQILDKIVRDFEERIDCRFKAFEEKLDMKYDVLIELIETLYPASSTEDEGERDLHQVRFTKKYQGTGVRAVRSAAMVGGPHCYDDSPSRTSCYLPTAHSNSQGVESSHRLKRKRGFENEGNEKNTIKFRIVGCGGWNEDEEADLVPIRNEYEMFDVMPSWVEYEDDDKENIDFYTSTAINMDSSPKGGDLAKNFLDDEDVAHSKKVAAHLTEVLDALGGEFLKDVGLDIVVEALDNVTARMYMNMRCWFFQELLPISKILSPLKPPPEPPPLFSNCSQILIRFGRSSPSFSELISCVNVGSLQKFVRTGYPPSKK